MTPALAVLAAVNVGVLWAILRAAAKFLGALSGMNAQSAAPVGGSCEEQLNELRRQMRDLEDIVQRLPARWEEIKREASRLDGRARYAARSALAELEKRGATDARLEAVGDELGLFDDDGSEPEGVLPLRSEVESDPGPGIPLIPDWERLALARKFAG